MGEKHHKPFSCAHGVSCHKHKCMFHTSERPHPGIAVKFLSADLAQLACTRQGMHCISSARARFAHYMSASRVCKVLALRFEECGNPILQGCFDQAWLLRMTCRTTCFNKARCNQGFASLQMARSSLQRPLHTPTHIVGI